MSIDRCAELQAKLDAVRRLADGWNYQSRKSWGHDSIHAT